VFGGRERRLEWIAVHAICWFVVIFGRVVGLKGSYDEYTPLELRNENVGKKRR
jgi:hypothetical protein